MSSLMETLHIVEAGISRLRVKLFFSSENRGVASSFFTSLKNEAVTLMLRKNKIKYGKAHFDEFDGIESIAFGMNIACLSLSFVCLVTT